MIANQFAKITNDFKKDVINVKTSCIQRWATSYYYLVRVLWYMKRLLIDCSKGSPFTYNNDNSYSLRLHVPLAVSTWSDLHTTVILVHL